MLPIYQIFIYIIMESELKQLIAQKDKLQASLTELQNQITALNQMYKLDKGVIDAEGFPRADLDFGQISNYRNLKRKKAELNNDHFGIMKQIQSKLFQLHKNLPDVEGEQQIFSTKQHPPASKYNLMQEKHEKIQQKPHKIDYLTPFAKISFVNPGSPADQAGVKEGDLLSQFSEVTIYTIDNMKEIPKHVREGKPLKIVVLRPLPSKTTLGENIFELKDGNNYEKKTIEVIPAVWAGKGILGCKFDPI